MHWERSSNGSGADGEGWTHLGQTYASTTDSMGYAPNDVSTSEQAENEQDEEYTSMMMSSSAFGAGELPAGCQMTSKIPPAYGGHTTWFAFEELVLDWEDSCQLDKALRGPALKNRLYGDATVYKPMLDRIKLKDPDDGVNYFLRTLRPKFVKGAQTIFLYRLFRFNKLRRGKFDIVRWNARFELEMMRFRDSWNDLYVDIHLNSPD